MCALPKIAFIIISQLIAYINCLSFIQRPCAQHSNTTSYLYLSRQGRQLKPKHTQTHTHLQIYAPHITSSFALDCAREHAFYCTHTNPTWDFVWICISSRRTCCRSMLRGGTCILSGIIGSSEKSTFVSTFTQNTYIHPKSNTRTSIYSLYALYVLLHCATRRPKWCALAFAITLSVDQSISYMGVP